MYGSKLDRLASGRYHCRTARKGTSMARWSRRNGLSSSTLANALARARGPKGELIIAESIRNGTTGCWPSRYLIRARMSLSTERGL